MEQSSPCPLCAHEHSEAYASDRRRDYLQCQRCDLVWVPARFHLSEEAERAEYDLHQNRVDDPSYRRFLSRLAQPLVRQLPDACQGLDFGCGPGPALAAMLSEAGHHMALYDLFYADDRSVLNREFDFITATEVVEHLSQPGEVLSGLWRQLRPGGCLGVMTKLVRSREAFEGWHYKNDPTHISFFSRSSWQWWAGEYGAELQFHGDDAMLLLKAQV